MVNHCVRKHSFLYLSHDFLCFEAMTDFHLNFLKFFVTFTGADLGVSRGGGRI